MKCRPILQQAEALGVPVTAVVRGDRVLDVTDVDWADGRDRASAETNVTFVYVLLRDPAAVREHAERAACAETEGMARPSGTVMIFKGWALAQEGQVQAGLVQRRQFR